MGTVVLRFLFFQHLHDHFAPEQKLQITNIITHKGLATQLQRRNQYDQPFCNTTLSPDWEIFELSHRTNQKTATSHPRYHWAYDTSSTTPDTLDKATPVTPKTFHPKLRQLLYSTP
jgi:hypothetical protein